MRSVNKLVIWLKNQKIYSIYYFAVLFYLLPIIVLFIFLLDYLTIQLTDIFPLGVLFMMLLPCSIIGLILNIVGFLRARKEKNIKNRKIGMAGLLISLALILLGLFGFMIIYIVTS